MLKRFCLQFVCVAVFVSCAAVFAAAQPTPKKSPGKKPVTIAVKQPRNVVDFYLLLPDKYVGNYSRAVRQKKLKDFGTTDTQNGYLEILAQRENDANIYVAIFKRDAGSYLITTASGKWSDTGLYKYNFFEYDGKTFKDVTKQVLPEGFKFSDYGTEGYVCALPRFDRTMNCRNAEGKITYLGWTGKDFVIE
jgi:hypothetical protein